jgi:hypothetical protein
MSKKSVVKKISIGKAFNEEVEKTLCLGGIDPHDKERRILEVSRGKG